jgi:hypothetical protein
MAGQEPCSRWHGGLGEDQRAWVGADLKGRSASIPIVVFAQVPLWTTYKPWVGGTGVPETSRPIKTPP